MAQQFSFPRSRTSNPALSGKSLGARTVPNDMYKASLDGIGLEIETLEDGFEKAIAQYEFPYKAGAMLEDMGLKARQVKIRCYFWDQGSHKTYDKHIELLDYLESTDLVELSHPKYGLMEGCVQSISVRQDDRQRCAELDISFIENTPGEDDAADDMTGAVGSAYGSTLTAGGSLLSGSFLMAVGAAALGLLSKVLTSGQSVRSQVPAGSGRLAVSAARAVDKAAAKLDAVGTTVTNPATSRVGGTTFESTVTGRLVESIAKCVERQSIVAADTSAGSPARYAATATSAVEELASVTIPSLSPASQSGGAVAGGVGSSIDAPQGDLDTGMTFAGSVAAESITELVLAAAAQVETPSSWTEPSLEHYLLTATLPAMVRLIGAAQVAADVADLFDTDQREWGKAKKAEKTRSFDALGRYTALETVEILTVGELEATLATVRRSIQDAMDFARAAVRGRASGDASFSGLKTAAVKLQEHVAVFKIERERLVKVALDSALPLHLVCLIHGLDYHAAERLVAVNPQIRNPNRAAGEVWIYGP